MFARVKKSGKYQYLQIVENRKEDGKVKQRVITTLGRMDQLKEKDRIDTAKIKSEARFDGKWVLTTNTDLSPFPGGAQVQGTMAGGESLPGRQIVAYDPSDLPPMR